MRRKRWEAVVPAVMMALMMLWVAACTTSGTAVELERLAGRWSWLHADGGIAGWRITPATEGYAMEVRFLANGDAQMYRDGELVTATTFEVGIGREDGSFAGREVVRFAEPLLGGWTEMAVEIPQADQLILADGCCDGYAYTFVRVGAAP